MFFCSIFRILVDAASRSCIGIFLRDPVDPGSCPLVCSWLLWVSDLANYFIVGLSVSWILHSGYVMGSQGSWIL